MKANKLIILFYHNIYGKIKFIYNQLESSNLFNFFIIKIL